MLKFFKILNVISKVVYNFSTSIALAKETSNL